MAEWSIAPVLKTGNGKPFVSSNLTASAKHVFCESNLKFKDGCPAMKMISIFQAAAQIQVSCWSRSQCEYKSIDTSKNALWIIPKCFKLNFNFQFEKNYNLIKLETDGGQNEIHTCIVCPVTDPAICLFKKRFSYAIFTHRIWSIIFLRRRSNAVSNIQSCTSRIHTSFWTGVWKTNL